MDRIDKKFRFIEMNEQINKNETYKKKEEEHLLNIEFTYTMIEG